MARITKQDIIRFAKENGFKVLDTPLMQGDSYLAGRNTKIELLTCVRVTRPNLEYPWVVAKEVAYSYDLHECVKVELQKEVTK